MVFSSCCCSCCNDWSFCRSATLPPFAAGACTAHLGTTLKGNELGAGPDTAREMFRTVLAVSVLHSGKAPSNAAGDYWARVLTLRSSVDMSVFPSCYCCCSYSCCGCDTYSLPVADMGMMLQQVDAMTQVQYNMCLAVIAMLVTPAGGVVVGSSTGTTGTAASGDGQGAPRLATTASTASTACCRWSSDLVRTLLLRAATKARKCAISSMLRRLSSRFNAALSFASADRTHARCHHGLRQRGRAEHQRFGQIAGGQTGFLAT